MELADDHPPRRISGVRHVSSSHRVRSFGHRDTHALAHARDGRAFVGRKAPRAELEPRGRIVYYPLISQSSYSQLKRLSVDFVREG